MATMNKHQNKQKNAKKEEHQNKQTNPKINKHKKMLKKTNTNTKK
jgi:hypothetical protein